MTLNSIPIAGPIPGGTSPDPGKQSKIHEAAQQFESLMVSEMLKSARESASDGWLGSGGDSGEDSAMDMAESQFATALSKGGGLGLASIIERALTTHTVNPQNETETVGAKLQGVSAKKP